MNGKEIAQELRAIATKVRELETENATLRAQLDRAKETLAELRSAATNGG